MTCKTKQFFNSFRSEKSKPSCFFRAMPNATIFIKAVDNMFWCIVVAIILVPCIIKPLNAFGWQEWLEVENSPSMLVENSLKEFGSVGGIVAKGWVKSQEFILKGSSEIGCGFVKLLNPSALGVSAFGKEVGDKGTNGTACNRPDRKATKFNWHDFFLGFYNAILSIIVFLVIRKLLLCTQL